MDYVSGINAAYQLGKTDLNALPRAAAKEEISKEFLSIFLDEIMKETFKDQGESSRMTIMREVVMEKLSEDLLSSDVLSMKEVLSDGRF